MEKTNERNVKKHERFKNERKMEKTKKVFGSKMCLFEQILRKIENIKKEMRYVRILRG